MSKQKSEMVNKYARQSIVREVSDESQEDHESITEMNPCEDSVDIASDESSSEEHDIYNAHSSC